MKTAYGGTKTGTGGLSHVCILLNYQLTLGLYHIPYGKSKHSGRILAGLAAVMKAPG
jgi:hypothetical protein